MEFVQYSLDDGIATIRIDDGKRNALAPSVLREIHAAFDRAEDDKAIVIVTGRDNVFSAGFDLKVMKQGGLAAIGMLRRGYKLPARVLSYPYPVIVACNGHALAMGVFLMLSADYVIGTRGDFKIAANEVAIGMTMPRVAAAVLRNRLDPSAFQKAVTVAQYFDVDSAKTAGFFDELVAPGELMARATALAKQFRELDMRAHRKSKRQIRRALTWKLRGLVPLDLVSAALQGMRRR
ncbi:MAG: crotonase/enoyl-CoA hydratase family protein [Woeseiaceae bacterium]|jgi:enoyl-CoA hydratase